MKTLFAPRAWLAAAIIVLVAASEGGAVRWPRHPRPSATSSTSWVGVVIAKFGTVYDYYFGSAKPPAD